MRRAGAKLEGSECLVLGAGGAGAAAAYGLRRSGALVTIVNRTVERGAQAAARFGCRAAGIDSLKGLVASADVVVSALPPGVSLIEEQWLRRGAIVLDASYPGSVLAEAARRRGCTFVSGESWLANQAKPAFRVFTGAEPDAEAMETALRAPGHPAERRSIIALIGFMGSGKSAVGRFLAGVLGRRFVDTDALIEERHGAGIPEIFATRGEAYFRAAESAVLSEALRGENLVVGCGGGAVLDERNRLLLGARALTVWLYAAPRTCVERMAPNSRPLIDWEDSLRSARRMLGERLALYARTADLVVCGEGRPEAAAWEIADEIA